MNPTAIFVVMGVSGSGKSTVAQALAEAHRGCFLDADDFHSESNIEKMRNGTPLTDEDRGPWLDRLNAELIARSSGNVPVFLACSALKQIYRSRLTANLPTVRIVYLKGAFDLIHERMKKRHHFMPAALLQSQFDTLMEPMNAIVLDISKTMDQMLADFERAR